MKWAARFRARLRRRSLRPAVPAYEGGAYWDRNPSLMTRDQSILRVFVVVNNEDLQDNRRWVTAAKVANIVRGIARDAVHAEADRRAA